MNALAGTLGIVVALVSAAILAVRGFRLARSEDPDPKALTVPVAGVLGGSVAAFLLLEIAILRHDFSIAYVADNTATTTPLLFLFAGAWAALEGSIVLWGLMLAVYTWTVVRTLRHGDRLGLAAMGVIGLVAVFWFGVMATVGNPFSLCTEVVGGTCAASSPWPLAAAVAPAEGLGPNPLLQNHILMAVHPPFLYLGYVGMTVPFAFAMAALVLGAQGREWLERSHRWTVVAWVFLTVGILMGGWWSYAVLGWGGYWAWDPVENAAFLPWLTATAFLHSAVVQRRRGMLQAWNFVLVIATFGLTVFGTFLTRSGVIASVHAFAQGPMGPVLLGFLLVVLLVPLGLFASRAHLVSSSPRLDSLSSREGFILFNNLVLSIFAFTVLFGTTYPLVVQAMSGQEVSVGAPFFDRVAIPLGLVLLLLVGVGSVAPWRVAKASVLWRRLMVPIDVGLLAGAATVLLGVRSVGVVGAVALGGFVIGSAINWFVVQLRRARTDGRSWPAAARKVVMGDPGYWGGQLAHVGVALLAIGIVATTVLVTRDRLDLAPGDSAVVGGYCVRYEGSFLRSEPHRQVQGERFSILDAGCATVVDVMEPRVNVYPNFSQGIATPAIRVGLDEDLYLALSGGSEGRVLVDVIIFPLQWLVWIAGGIVAAGGVVALGRRSRRGALRREGAEVP